MTQEEVEFTREVMQDNFVFMDNRSGGASDIDSILRKASECVLRYGSRILVIDPYNYIDMVVAKRPMQLVKCLRRYSSGQKITTLTCSSSPTLLSFPLNVGQAKDSGDRARHLWLTHLVQ